MFMFSHSSGRERRISTWLRLALPRLGLENPTTLLGPRRRAASLESAGGGIDPCRLHLLAMLLVCIDMPRD
jgi:hypothetical protein